MPKGICEICGKVKEMGYLTKLCHDCLLKMQRVVNSELDIEVKNENHIKENREV